MKRPTKSHWQAIAFAAIATLAFLFGAQFEVAAQSEIQFNVLYECPRSPHNFKVLSCPNEKYCEALGVNKYTPSASYKFEIDKSSLVDVFKQGGCTVGGKPLVWGENTAPQDGRAQNNQQQTEKNKNARSGRFKVGERVKACPMQMENCADYWENCTVAKDYMVTEGADAYQLLCDDPKGGKGTLANVPPKFIRAGAPPPPATPDCPFNEPAGKVSRTSPPSEQLFKRVIFEQYRDKSNGSKVGITYQSFQLGKSYVNRLTGNGLLHDGAPQGATINTVKTTFILCDRHTDSTIRWVYEAQYSCFKDNFGDWICPNDALKLSEPIYLPNK
jgi:hypothetical protein